MKKIILSLFVMLSILALGIKTKTLKADATVTLTEGASIRLDDPAGLRFQATVSEPIAGAKYGIAFANGTLEKDKVQVGADGVVNVEVDELNEDNSYAVSMVKIPERAYFSSITARAYILIDNTYIYSDNVVTRNINEVARIWKKDNPNKQSDFITQVLTIAKLNTNGGTIRYKNHEAMVEDFLKDFNTYSSKIVTSATELYDAGNVYGTFFTNTEMYNKWSWTLELFLSLTEQGYGNNQDAKTQYETFLLRNGTSVTSQEYLRQSIQSLMTLSKCTSYNEEATIDFSLYEVSKQIEGAINGGKEFVNINNLFTIAYRNGYTFEGWYDEDDNLVTTLTEGIELYAKWNENYQLEIDAAYDLTESTLDLPTIVTIDGKKISVTWDTTTFIEKQIGNQILTGTYTDEYNKEYPIKIKVNVLPYTFRQNTSTKEYTITKYYGTNESVVVPSTYRGEKITSIGSVAFLRRSSLTSIELPSSVTSIGRYAFDDCTSLTNVYYTGTIEDWCNITFSDYDSNPMYYATHFYMKDSNNEYKEVTEIEIPDTVTSIGDSQFCGFSSLKSITLPSTIISIGSEAFYLCSSLTNIVIPSSVTSICDRAFYNCSSLTSIEIPSTVTNICSYAFSGCNSLTNVYYAGTIEYWCNITFNNYGSNPMSYATHFYMKDSNNEYEEVTKIEIPDTITSISDYRFYNFTALKSITIPSSVTSIGKSAFYYCSSLTKVYYNGTIEDWCNITFSSYDSNPMYYATHFYMKDSNNEYQEVTEIVIPDTITEISYCRFYNFTALKSISIPSSVTSIGYGAFCNCSSLTSINIPEGVTSIGSEAFYNCSSLTSINIPEGVTSIGSEAFYNCSSLKNIEIPSSLTSTGKGAFSGCSSLLNVYYSGTIENWFNCNFYYDFFYNRYYDSIYFSTYSNPMEYATHFYMKDSNNEYKEVTEIEIPDTITKISAFKFNNFTLLKNITIPSSIIELEFGSFNGCSSLKNVYYNGTVEEWCNIKLSSSVNNSLSNPMRYATHFYMKDSNNEYSEVTEIELPDTITSISDYRFYNFTSLKSITLPSSITSIGLDAFYNCSSLTLIINNSDLELSIGSADNGYIAYYAYKIINNDESITYKDNDKYTYVETKADFLFRYDENNNYQLVAYFGTKDTVTLPIDINGNSYEIYEMKGVRNVIIPDTFTSIGDYAFYDCRSLTSIEIPSSVTSIGQYPFTRCDSLININVDIDNNTYKSIDGNLYSKDGKTLIKYAIGKKENVFTIPLGVTNIGSEAFFNCNNLISVVISLSISNVGTSAFGVCSSLTNVYYDGTIEDWCNITFSDDRSNPMNYATHFYMKDSNNEYKEVTEIEIPDTISTIGKYQFFAFNNITKIIIPSSVTSIGQYAFSGCSSLTIYCEAESKPSGWNSYWNISNCPVVWGYKKDN